MATISMSILNRLAIAMIVGLAVQGLRAEPLSGTALTTALRQGGYVLVMRHTSSPEARPDKAGADPENTNLERQLDQTGRESAHAMGEAIRKLGIPIGEVLSSPTYRALETVRLASFGQARTFPELGDGGQSMQRITETPAAWLRNRVGEPPRAGTDTLMVTHMPNIVAAFGDSAKGATDGETFVFRPDGKGAAELVARIKVEEWPTLASRQ
jgi:phosphohistidine phosphatase SixA